MQLYISNSKDKKNEHRDYSKSFAIYPGAFCSILFGSISAFYLAFLFKSMITFELDDIQSTSMVNLMDTEENNNFDMYERFLPSLDIRSLKTSPNSTEVFKAENPTIDIFDTTKSKDEDNFAIDVKKLENYIVF